MSAPAAAHATRGRLALAFEEVFTAIGRLRDHRQVPTDATVFRTHIKGLLAEADESARRMGYPAEFVKSSVYATVALLDESMLGTPGQLASVWAGRPLQEEIFGDFIAGEAVFQQLQELLNRQDSAYVADVLEVYLICLYLGFKGRYSVSEGGELRSYMTMTSDKILRVRGGFAPLAAHARPPDDEGIAVAKDVVERRLMIGLAVSAGVVALVVMVSRLALITPGVREVEVLLTSIGL